MQSYRRIIVLSALICLGSLGLACENGHSSYGPQTGPVNANKSGTASTPQLTDTDRTFAIEAATAGKHEVALGRLAAERASNADVKAFANRMVQDHSRAGDELMQINSRLGITVPAEDDAAFKQKVDRLTGLNGAEFDRAYMSEMVAGHTMMQDKVSGFTSSGTNADLKGWASKALPTVREHLKLAQDLAAKVGAPKMK